VVQVSTVEKTDVESGGRVCAIVLDYFGRDKLLACIKSLSSQGVSILLIVDNSGSKGEYNWIKSSVKGLEKDLDFKEIIVLNAGENLGFSAGINFGFSWVNEKYSCDYCLLINNDAVASKNMVMNLHAYLIENPDVAMVSPVIKTGESLSGVSWYHRWLGVNASKESVGFFPWLSGCCLLLSKSYFKKEIFNDSFFMYGEDVELSWRLHQKGIEYKVVENAFVSHEKVGSSSEGGLFYEYYMNRGHLILSIQLANSNIEVPLMLIAKFAYLFCRSLIRCLRFGSLVPFFALLLSCFPLKIHVYN